MRSDSLLLAFQCPKNEDRFFAPQLFESRNRAGFFDPERQGSKKSAAFCPASPNHQLNLLILVVNPGLTIVDRPWAESAHDSPG